MDMEELVRAVVREVLERTASGGAKPCVMVLASRETSLAERVGALMAPFYANGADVLFLGEDNGGRTPERRLLPSLSCSDMADLAAGRASSPCMKETLGLLLRGETVEVLEFAYRSYVDTAPGPLYDLYVSYEKTLAGYGLKEFRPWKPESARVRETLITAAMVERAGAEGRRALIVPAKANVTPLAAETADVLRVRIVKEG